MLLNWFFFTACTCHDGYPICTWPLDCLVNTVSIDFLVNTNLESVEYKLKNNEQQVILLLLCCDIHDGIRILSLCISGLPHNLCWCRHAKSIPCQKRRCGLHRAHSWLEVLLADSYYLATIHDQSWVEHQVLIPQNEKQSWVLYL